MFQMHLSFAAEEIRLGDWCFRSLVNRSLRDMSFKLWAQGGQFFAGRDLPVMARLKGLSARVSRRERLRSPKHTEHSKLYDSTYRPRIFARNLCNSVKIKHC